MNNEIYLTEVGQARVITPDCSRTDCRVQKGVTTTTAMGWNPVYDKWGNMISENPNKSTTEMHCLTCGKLWTRTV